MRAVMQGEPGEYMEDMAGSLAKRLEYKQSSVLKGLSALFIRLKKSYSEQLMTTKNRTKARGLIAVSKRVKEEMRQLDVMHSQVSMGAVDMGGYNTALLSEMATRIREALAQVNNELSRGRGELMSDSEYSGLREEHIRIKCMLGVVEKHLDKMKNGFRS